MGWIGIMRQVTYYLSVVGADKDEEGRFLIGGDGVVTFMGMQGENAETVIGDETVYFVGGRPVKLAAALGSTSYGMQVVVI